MPNYIHSFETLLVPTYHKLKHLFDFVCIKKQNLNHIKKMYKMKTKFTFSLKELHKTTQVFNSIGRQFIFCYFVVQSLIKTSLLKVCALLWSNTYKEIVSGHGYANNQLTIWKYPSLTKVSLTRHNYQEIFFFCILTIWKL